MIDWISTNKEWVFSGIGIFVLSGIIGLIKLLSKESKPPTVISLNQKGGSFSKNSQIGIQNNYGDKKNE